MIIGVRRRIDNAAANSATEGDPLRRAGLVRLAGLWVTTLTNQQTGRSIKVADLRSGHCRTADSGP